MNIGTQQKLFSFKPNRITNHPISFRMVDETVYEALTTNTTSVFGSIIYNNVRVPVFSLINASARQIEINFKNLMKFYVNR